MRSQCRHGIAGKRLSIHENLFRGGGLALHFRGRRGSRLGALSAAARRRRDEGRGRLRSRPALDDLQVGAPAEVFLRAGIQAAAFEEANRVRRHRPKLVSLDNGYEPARPCNRADRVFPPLHPDQARAARPGLRQPQPPMTRSCSRPQLSCAEEQLLGLPTACHAG